MCGSRKSGIDIPVLINTITTGRFYDIMSACYFPRRRVMFVPYGDVLVEVVGDVADEASHEHQDHAAAAIECHHDTDLGHSPVN